MKKFAFVAVFLISTLFFANKSEAQIHVGVYQGGVLSQIGVGTDIDKKIFGEVRLLASDVVNYVLGIEALGHYNLKQTDFYNLHAGLMVGVSQVDEGRVGIPLGLSFKPIQSHKNFSILMEGTPFVALSTVTVRANIGLRYSFQKE